METPKPKMKMNMPDLNPFVAEPAMCPLCGELIYPRVKKELNASGELKTTQLANGKITALEYFHYNPEKGCAYKVDHIGARLTGQLFGLKQAEIDAFKEIVRCKQALDVEMNESANTAPTGADNA